MSFNSSAFSLSTSDLSLPSPTSAPGYLSASAGPVAPLHLSGIEPMDWVPENNHAVLAWKYQQETLPALVAAGGPFELPPRYAYFPLPINWEAAAKYYQLCQNGGTGEQFLQLQLDLDSWHRRQLAVAVEEDKLFLENRFRAAVRNEKPLAEVIDVLRQQERVQLAFAGQPLLLQQFVQQQQQQVLVQHQQQQQQPQPLPRQPTDQQRLIQERVAALRQKEADRLAASAPPTPPPSTPAQATAQPDFGAALRAAAAGASSSSSPSFGSSFCSSSSSSSSAFSSASSLNSPISSSAPSPAPARSTRPRKFGGLASQVNLVVR
ncbi:hypothetical protein DL98DRAFT_571171 [Cadophora sp. DSE1049]|nr:hypothetical protein DL98DRAFT_571171 [Cadophora sp. DSE1049]